MKLPKSLPLQKKPKVYLRRIAGDSMSPTLCAGQLVLFVATQKYSPGAVIMFRHNELEKVKRISRVDGARLYVLGDNPSASTDSRNFGWIEGGQVLGRLILPSRATTQ